MTVAEPSKRVHYFDHQFLRAKDFTDEQDYHVGMRRLHSRMLHTWGIAEGGLKLSVDSGASRVDISEGVAVDGEGREIVLREDDQTPDLSGLAGKTIFITISYDQQETDATEETGVTGNTRWEEKPIIGISENAPRDPSQQLILGRATVVRREDGTISIETDDGEEPNRRRAAGVVGGDMEMRSLALTDPDVISTQWPRMRLGAANRADLAGNLHVTGNINFTGILNGNIGPDMVTTTQIANNAVTEAKLANNAVTAGKLRADANDANDAQRAVTTNHIRNSAVTEAKLATNAVSNRTIQDNAVTAAKIQNGTIGPTKLLDNSIPLSKINKVTTVFNITIPANSTNILFLPNVPTTDHHFFLASIIPSTPGTVKWDWEVTRISDGNVRYRLIMTNPQNTPLDVNVRVFDLMEF
jgi:hypothetical protein